ncbi:sodium:proton antiporter [Candidatus Sumerlaeota bacterium]|nr:sodium:proton antiporter [Candidatus Sumerlaeota bacterium]
MRTVLIFSALLVVGLAGSQVLPAVAGGLHSPLEHIIRLGTMLCLAFIMIRVGLEFQIDKSNLRQYGWDYVVAFTAATFPWILVAAYFVWVIIPSDPLASGQGWQEALIAGRFAAPTSAGVLFAMLAGAGLASTWLFRKARILAIFDDLDTVLLMIPLKMMIVGLAWQLGIIGVAMIALLLVGYLFLNHLRWPTGWPWLLIYSAIITAISEKIYVVSKMIDADVPIHFEVLLPAFVLGVLLHPGHDPSEEMHGEPPAERRAALLVSSVFMVLVGLSMPAILTPVSGGADLDWATITLHVLVITVLCNLGKMFPALCYRREAHWRERLAVAIAMWPRGEVGAGILIVSLSYGIGGDMITVAMLSLALNLALTGVFIWWVKALISPLADAERGDDRGAPSRLAMSPGSGTGAVLRT